MSHKNISSTSISFDFYPIQLEKSLNKSFGISFHSFIKSYLILKLLNEMWDNWLTHSFISIIEKLTQKSFENPFKTVFCIFFLSTVVLYNCFFSFFFSMDKIRKVSAFWTIYKPQKIYLQYHRPIYYWKILVFVSVSSLNRFIFFI